MVLGTDLWSLTLVWQALNCAIFLTPIMCFKWVNFMVYDYISVKMLKIDIISQYE